MKIGIITCFDLKNLNYGNRLQAYALNYYLNKVFDGSIEAETLYFQEFKDFKRTKKEPLFNRIQRKINRDYLHRNEKKIPDLLRNRLNNFNDFSKRNIQLVDHPLAKEELKDLEYDTYVVGSDVVWYQWNYGIRPIKLLDFQTNKKFKKIAYAASFGNDYIPRENISELRRCFSTFSNISVREKSSVEIMKSLGRSDAEYVMDPTMLLTPEEWEKIEQPMGELKHKEFIFVYLLSSEERDRNEIKRIACNANLPIVTIPYASGKLNLSDATFGDYKVIDCSPETWLWLIHNAAFVITDSFHGTVFSTKFHSNFIVTMRKEKFEMNNRMRDFLKTIRQEDKFVDLSCIDDFEGMRWDFKEIDNVVNQRIDFSKEFLKRSLQG